MINWNVFFKISALCLLLIISAPTSFGQKKKFDWSRDTLSSHSASNRLEKYRNHFEKDPRNITPTIFIPVEKLKAIVDICAENNVENVQFLLAVIRPEDTTIYFHKRPSLARMDKHKIINRQTLIIKIPRRAAAQLTGATNGFQKFLLSMLAFGYIKVDNEYGLFDDEFIYFDIGFICPPPSDCAN
ncbi:MAG: hypothetical protein M3352_04110 [Bacteroidota bacterium]|nr:hypothetical protein [Bacteroidota bacterium]